MGIFDGGLAQIGAALYDSWIIEACMRVPGIIGVVSLAFTSVPSADSDADKRHDPGEGGFFTLNQNDLTIVFDGTGASS